jgi:hypothetical protein
LYSVVLSFIVQIAGNETVLIGVRMYLSYDLFRRSVGGRRGLLVTAVLMSSAVGLTGVAQANASARAATGPSVAASSTADLDCGLLSCNYVFSRQSTNTIADAGPGAVRLCQLIPRPGSDLCVANFAAAVVTAKLAQHRGECLQATWSRARPNVIAFTTTGSACR